MSATQNLAFNFPVEVTLKIDSVTAEWIEGRVLLKAFGGDYEQPFKTKNNAEQDFNIPTPIGDINLHIKAYMENQKRVCIDGYVEKIVKVPFNSVCVDV